MNTNRLLTSIFTIAIISGIGLSTPLQYAQAHVNPLGCNTSGHSTSFQVYLDASLTIPINILTDADVGNTVYLTGTLGDGPNSSDCAYEGGTVKITTPLGTIVDVTPIGGVSCIGGTAIDVAPLLCTVQVLSQQSLGAPYVVSLADRTGDVFISHFAYAGKAHSNTGDTASKTFTEEIEIPFASTKLTKTPSAEKVTLGTEVTFTYVETNDGGTDIFSPSVEDDMCAPVDYVSGDDSDGILNPGESWTFECTSTMGTAGTFTNTAIAHGLTVDDRDIAPPLDPHETAQATVKVIDPSITLEKTANPLKVKSGELVTYSYKVCNTGNVDLDPVDVTDNQYGVVGSTSLIAGECKTLTLDKNPTKSIDNIGTATGEYQLGTVEDSDDASVQVVTIKPDLVLQKTCDPATQNEPGTITWNIAATNTGDTVLNVVITDSEHGAVFAGAIPIGGSVGPFPFVDGPLAAGTYTDTATATFETQLGQDHRIASATCTVTQKGVGGEILPIDNTALLLAGINSSAVWMLPALAGIIGAGAYIVRTRMN